jgi:hypothetical protein
MVYDVTTSCNPILTLHLLHQTNCGALQQCKRSNSRSTQTEERLAAEHRRGVGSVLRRGRRSRRRRQVATSATSTTSTAAGASGAGRRVACGAGASGLAGAEVLGCAFGESGESCEGLVTGCGTVGWLLVLRIEVLR